MKHTMLLGGIATELRWTSLLVYSPVAEQSTRGHEIVGKHRPCVYDGGTGGPEGSPSFRMYDALRS